MANYKDTSLRGREKAAFLWELIIPFSPSVDECCATI
jgi:hypothetical protein